MGQWIFSNSSRCFVFRFSARLHNSIFAPTGMFFFSFFKNYLFFFLFKSECPLIVSCGKPLKFDSCLTRVCLTIGKPALQSKPKKRLTRKKETSIHLQSPRISFYLSPGEHVFKVLCHWNHIGELKTTLCGTPDALTVFSHHVLF